MTKISVIATALCLGVCSVAVAQTPGSAKSQPGAIQSCEGLTGDALDKCKREAAPGKSGDAASRAGGASPGGSGDATSRTGTPPSRAGDTLEKGKK